jgi:hypothetical protein
MREIEACGGLGRRREASAGAHRASSRRQKCLTFAPQQDSTGIAANDLDACFGEA